MNERQVNLAIELIIAKSSGSETFLSGRSLVTSFLFIVHLKLEPELLVSNLNHIHIVAEIYCFGFTRLAVK